MLPPNTILRERYRIINQLGHGGMGAVYQAMDENLNCLVVVKETFAINDEQRQAFRREAQLLANLNHPTLPKVMDHFTHDRGQFLVMEFVSGHDLAELMSLRERPFAVEKVVLWADQLLDALDELHSYDPPIVHRDIKPANLKVTLKDRIILLDFGLAKGAAGQMSTADAGSHPQSIYGYTLNYAPLEQIRGAGTDPRSDLYSLGATMWSLLTGQIPPDALARVGDKEEGKPDPLRQAHELNPQVTTRVSEALQQAMSLNRNQRPASAAEMRAALFGARLPRPEVATEYLPSSKENLGSGSSDDVTLKITETTAAQPTQDNHSLPTMTAVQPPVAPSKEIGLVPPTVASVPTVDAGSNETRKSGPLTIVFVGALVVLIIIGALVAFGFFGRGLWKRTSTNPNTSSTTPAKTITNKIGMQFIWIQPGSFTMGVTDSEAQQAYEEAHQVRDSITEESFKNAQPKHQVTLSEGFYMGQYEVTEAQWRKIMGTTLQSQRQKEHDSDPTSMTSGDTYPMRFVSWNEAQEFVGKLNQMNDGYAYRLPSESEWEYAARAGTTTRYFWGDDTTQACKYANVADQTLKDRMRPGRVNCSDGYDDVAPVGSFQPNGFGLYDVIGNVSELCQDAYQNSYNGAPVDGHAWLSSSNLIVVRGGTNYSYGSFLRSSYRDIGDRIHGSRLTGFRLVAVKRTQ